MALEVKNAEPAAKSHRKLCQGVENDLGEPLGEAKRHMTERN